MKGFIIQSDLESWINWQGLIVQDIKYAIIFSAYEDAAIIRDSLCQLGSILPHERNDVSPGYAGSYHEYHRSF